MKSKTERDALEVWRRVDKALCVVCVSAFAGSALLGIYYGVMLPAEADPATGRTWGWNYRGKVVYLTDEQLAVLMALLVVSGACLIAMVLIQALVDPYGRRRGK